MDQRQALDRFLAGAERRALRTAELSTGNRAEALDIVQDAMLALVRKYGGRPPEEWGPLFHRILQSRIRDWFRRRRVRNVLRGWIGARADDDEIDADPIALAPASLADGPAERAERRDAAEELETAIRSLPFRQRQAFLLRAWDGLDVGETARAMGCSEGSVKTHYFRAVQNLRTRLGDEWR